MAGPSKSYWRLDNPPAPEVKTKDGVYTPRASSFSNTVEAASGGRTSLITVSAQSVGFTGSSLSAIGDGVSDVTTLFTSQPVDIPLGSNQVPILSADIVLTGGINSVEYREWNLYHYNHAPGSHVMDGDGKCTSNPGMDADYYAGGHDRENESYTVETAKNIYGQDETYRQWNGTGGAQINRPDGNPDRP